MQIVLAHLAVPLFGWLVARYLHNQIEKALGEY